MTRRALFPILLIAFTLSGLTGLVYQVVWGRMLALVFGGTTAATGTVLAVFMGGLALGGWLAGRRADALQRPLWVYGLLEGGIGLLALLLPPLFAIAEGLAASFGESPLSLLFRFVLTCVLLLPPTILMGATLPVLSRLCAIQPDTLGSRLGTLYGANTLGAAFGAALAGFVLLPMMGVSNTLRLAALLNLGLGAVFLLVGRKSGIEATVPTTPEPGAKTPAPPKRSQSQTASRRTRSNEPAPAPAETTLSPSVLLWAFGFSGAIALVYEVAWTRALLLIIGSNVHAFATMLTTFLIGLFVGTLLMARFVDRLKNLLGVFAWLEAGVGVAAWGGFLAFDQLPWLNLTLLQSGSSLSMTWGRFGLAALIMLPTGLLLGTLFPVVVRLGRPLLAQVGRTIGDLYAANTVGAIAGALVATFILIPRLGTANTLHVAMAANMGIALYVRRHPPYAFLVLLVLVGWPLSWDMIPLTLAQTARREVARYMQQIGKFPYVSQADFLEQLHKDQELLYSADGRSSHIAVIKNPINTSLLTNGHSDGSDKTDMPTQILLAAIPLLLHPAPEQVAVVGWGTGVTCGVGLQFPLKAMTALEIEPKVLDTDAFFQQVNHNARRDPRLRLRFADGRNWFLTTSEKYDVIISEPSNVWQAGVCSLFTQEFFRLCRARLKANGLFTQWVGYGSMPIAEVRGILAALKTVFPYALVFRVDEFDAIIVASESPLQIEAAKTQLRFLTAGSALRADLEQAGVPNVARLVGSLQFGTDEMGAFCGSERPHTDDNVRLEFGIARAPEGKSYSAEGAEAFKTVRPADPFRYVNLADLSPAEQQRLRSEAH